MSKKILLNLSFSVWPMYGYELDFVQQKLNEGCTVKVLYCNGSPDFCSANNLNSLSNKKLSLVCSYCKSKFDKGIKWLNNSKNLIIENFELLNISQIDKIYEYENLLKKKVGVDEEVLEFLKSVNYHLEDIIRTTMISESWSIRFNHKYKKNFNLFKKISKQTIISFYSSLNHLEKFNPDELYIYNGRIYRYQPMLRLAQSKMKHEDIYTYEYPLFGFQNMMLVNKNYFADLKNISNELLKVSTEKNILFSKKESVAKNWIKNRETGENYKLDFYPWKRNQISGSLPKQFNKLNFNISYFMSTETEFLGIPENEKDFAFKNNLDIIETILKNIKYKSNVFLTVKTHPLVDKDSIFNLNQLVRLKNQYSNMLIIEPTSTADSYQLIKNSNLIIVMGSTVGIEAAFYKKNVISASNSPYMSFGAVKKIVDAKELNLLLDKCIKNNFEDFPSDVDKYQKAVDFIFTYINFNFKSKFLIKNKHKKEMMVRDGKIYKLEPHTTVKYLYKLYTLIRFILKIIKVYI